MDRRKTQKQTQRHRDFLTTIPAFSDFTDSQLITLEQQADLTNYSKGDVIFKQGDDGDAFYVLQHGTVEVLIRDDDEVSIFQRNSMKKKLNNLGKVVNKLTQGSFFGERALMTNEKRAATIRVDSESAACLVFSRAVYEEVISGNGALIGKDIYKDVDWSKDHETRSLFKHVRSVLDRISSDELHDSANVKVLYELNTLFTPELSVDEIVARMVITVKNLIKGDRVGLFVLSEDQHSMVLKVSERSKGIRLPIRGLAGAILQSNETINIADAYLDPRFDSTMDRRFGYRTRQLLGVPVRHPLTGEAIGLLQVNNRTDNSNDLFTPEEENILEVAAEQLSELLHGRAEIFIQSGESITQKNFGEGSGNAVTIMKTSDISNRFSIDVNELNLGTEALKTVSAMGITLIEVVSSVHIALTHLCEPQSVVVGVATDGDNNADPIIKIDSRIFFQICVQDLPRASRILFRIFGKKKSNSPKVPLGWAASNLFDFKACLDINIKLNLFPGDIEVPINTTLSNANDKYATSISVTLAANVVQNSKNSKAPDATNTVLVHSIPLRVTPLDGESLELSEEEEDNLDRILLLSFNPLSMSIISDADKDFLWRIRFSILDRYELLPAFVMCVRWNDVERVREFYDLLDLWSQPPPVLALQLLDRRFMDPKVRAYAVHCLENLPDQELSLYMLQLCQQLKFENYIDSALSRFLLRRALLSQRLIGHIFFWFLQSEVYNVDVERRFVILLQIYITNCGHHRVELGQQMFVMKRLEKVAELVCTGESKSERLEILRNELRTLVLPSEFQLPLNPNLLVRGIDVERCRVMESKKKPLWLTFKDQPVGGNDIVLMLKVGDDLRQDALILQLLKVMYELWRREGLDMEMMLYDCISTGYERGLLQVVLNSTTLASILLQATDRGKEKVKSGSLSRKLTSAMKALADFDHLKEWIWLQVLTDYPNDADDANRQSAMEKRTQNFIISTAAYCVASYVLGIGDRHNDNLMITRDGHFFHIDFGHILGNFKVKMGIKRERAPFVFTPAMKQVMSANQYEAFVDLCCDVYNILRANATLLVSLVALAIPCNLPELKEEKDVMWMYEKLLVGASDEEAADHFREQLETSLNTRGTRINDAAHMIAHG